MPANIKKVLLQKKISDTLYQIYPKTEAGIVEYTKTVVTPGEADSEVVTSVAAELALLKSTIDNNQSAALQAVADLQDAIEGLGDNESLQESFDTLKEIGDFLATHETSIGALAALIADVGTPSVAANPNAEPPVVAQAATGLHAAVEALQAVGSTKVSKTANDGTTQAANGHLYIDGVDTTVYSDTALVTEIGVEPDAGQSITGSGLKKRVHDLEAVGATKTSKTSGATTAANGHVFIDDADTTIYDDSELVTAIGTSDTTAGSGDGTGILGRLDALEAVGSTKVSKTNGGSTASNGHVYIDGTDTTIYDDTTLVTAIGTADTSAGAGDGTGILGRLDAIDTTIGVEPNGAQSIVGSGLKKRIADLEAVQATKVEDATNNGYIKVNNVDNAIQVYDDTTLVNEIGVEPNAAQSVVGSGLKKRVHDLEDFQAIQVVASAPTGNDIEDGVLYMVELT